MNRRIDEGNLTGGVIALLAVLTLSASAQAQVPVDEDGNPIGEVEALDAPAGTGNEDIPLLSTVDLEELVGPIALYPDDLLAIVLPASAYPLQIVDAARFLAGLEDDPSLEPNPEWDDSVVALTNYPEVVELLNEDIDWTWRLGEAVVSQQADVVAAIETFRDRAYAAGNLKSDAYQEVSRNEGIIEITPIAEDVIYVPYYEPERVVVYQPRPVYYYYPRPCPVYYYPYASTHAFNRGYFWGVTTAFSIGWYSDSLNVFHHSYHGHPYYGRSYWDRWWYRRPTINIYNHHYSGGNTTVTINHHQRGDRWRPRGDRREYLSDRRITRNRTYPVPRRRQNVDANSQAAPRAVTRRNDDRAERRERNREPIEFRERPRTAGIARTNPGARDDRAARGEGNRADRRSSGDRRTVGERAAASDRAAPVRRAAPRNTTTAARDRRETAPAVRRSQQRRATVDSRESGQRGVVSRQSERRSEPATSVRRRDAVRPQPRRSEPVAQVRRPAPATRSTRRTEPAVSTRRAQPTRSVARSAPSRPAARQEPRRQQTPARREAPAKSARKSESRKAPQRDSKRRR